MIYVGYNVELPFLAPQFILYQVDRLTMQLTEPARRSTTGVMTRAQIQRKQQATAGVPRVLAPQEGHGIRHTTLQSTPVLQGTRGATPRVAIMEGMTTDIHCLHHRMVRTVWGRLPQRGTRPIILS